MSFISRLSSSPGRAFALIFVLSAAARIAILPMIPLNPSWTVRWEIGAVAENLARTLQCADPYALPSGPTAHTIPFYTGVMALLFRLFGVTMAAEYARYLVITAGFSAMFAMLPWQAGRLGVPKQAGLLGGLLGALSPLHLVSGGSGEDCAAVALGLLMAASLARWTSARDSVGLSVLVGLGWGAAFHISPSLLPVMLACLGFELWWKEGRRKFLLAAVMMAGAMAVCVPWALRNYRVFHELVFIRSNFGLELRMGNHDGAFVDLDDPEAAGTHRHPRTSLEEARLVQSLGEMEYMRRARREAIQWMRENPGSFLKLFALRVIHFWCGPLHDPLAAFGTSLLTLLAILGARRILPVLATPQRAAFLIPLAAFPLANYVVSYMPRYRIPVDGILLLLAGVEFRHWTGKSVGRD